MDKNIYTILLNETERSSIMQQLSIDSVTKTSNFIMVDLL